MSTTQADPAFDGTRQFAIVERLGAGAMGVVYLAHDRARNHPVALKALRRVDPAGILQLKHEFRSLAGMSHPNLVNLHELFEEDGRWFFTMEHVAGVDFLRWVRFDGDAPRVDLDRLRAGLLQLTQGLVHLHQNRKLHRDIKPSNILVDRHGRVQLLDFGLVARLDDPRGSDGDGLSGTLEYMAPEVGQAEALTSASDWYSVGVLLFQCLTGALPYPGPPLLAHLAKRQVDAPAPSAKVADVPPDLDRLCRDLLQRDPARRPTGEEVLERLQGVPTVTPAPAPPPAATPGDLVGREPHLARLEQALAAAGEHAVVCLLHGSSGMGKSALVRRFLDGLERRDDLLVLAGRCYEREAVPYKALDNIIDELTRALVEMPERYVEALLPEDVPALARLFPVLHQIEAVAPTFEEDASPDPRRQRQRAFVALRDLLERLAGRWVPVIFIDDLQWGDADSAALLAEVLRPPAPPLLLLGSYRSEEAHGEFLAPFRAALARYGAGVDVRSIPVEALGAAASWRLVRALYGGERPLDADAADAIAREAAGNPFFIEALVQHVRLAGGHLEQGISVAEMLRSRLAALTPAGRRLVQVVAVAARPVLRAVACEAADVGAEEQTLLGRLRADHLVRVRSGRLIEELETYHDRVRESVLADLEPATRATLHHELAVHLERAGLSDPETLAEHFLAAGDLGKAHHYIAESAARAVATLAFDRAAALYQQALDLLRRSHVGQGSPPDPDQERALRVQLGHALVNAGRGVEASAAFLQAAHGAAPEEMLGLHRLAGEQLLASGRIKAGLDVMQGVLRRLGQGLPRSPMRALPGMLVRRLRLKLRGLTFSAREAPQIGHEDLARVDACWSLGIGLGFVDHIRAADFQLRSLMLALDSGERYRIARALGMEAAYAAALGPAGQARSLELQHKAARLAEEIQVPHALAMAQYGIGVSNFLLGYWAKARAAITAALEMLRGRCHGVFWEIASLDNMLLSTLAFLGELGEVAQRAPVLLEEAQARGDLYSATNMRTGYPNAAWLVMGSPDLAERHLTRAMDEWTHERGAQSYYALNARTHIDLYRGDGARAWWHVQKAWGPLRRSLIDQVHLVRVDSLAIRGRCAAAAAAATADHGAARVAGRMARRLLRGETAWGRAHGSLIQAALYRRAGDDTAAMDALRAAIETYEDNDMALYASAARDRLGRILGGDEGRVLVEGNHARMVAAGVADPEAITRMLAPGFDT